MEVPLSVFFRNCKEYGLNTIDFEADCTRTFNEDLMYQVTFSEQSMTELKKLGMAEQLQLMEVFSNLSPARLQNSSEEIGHLDRNGKRFYRLRVNDLRIYFEIQGENMLYAHYIVPQHSLSDFVFRFKLPVSEEQMIEQHSSFWKYLESIYK